MFGAGPGDAWKLLPWLVLDLRPLRAPFLLERSNFLVAAGAEEACDETLDPLLDQGLCGGFRARLGSNYLLFKLQS